MISVDGYSESPSTSKSDENVESLKELVHGSRRIIICELACELGISFG
jgi:hypothetical protein